MDNKSLMGFENLNVNIFGDKQIKVTRHVGDLKSATLEDGTVVHRQEKINLGDELGMVACPGMDNHFVFRHVFKRRGKPYGWTTWCTCSSPAIIAGYSGYKGQASPQGQLLVCAYYSGMVTGVAGKHADGSS